jgi:RimJ/RimL family protein N-acetyltransferase
MFDPQPALAGELVAVRPLRADDEDALYAAASDPLIWAQHPVPDRWVEANFRAYFAELLASGGALAVLDRATGDVIGTSRYHGYDEERSEVEIGWTFLARAYWGGRYNAELKELMLAHAFRFVRTVVFLVHPDNVRSQRAVEKVGARRVGTRPDAYGRASVVYAITRA